MNRIIAVIFLVFSLSQVYLSDFYISYYEDTRSEAPDIFYTPDAKYIKPLVLDYNNLAADLLWIKTISYFADEFSGAQNYKYLKKLLYIIADLDPLFEKVYIWGGSVLMYNGNWINAKRIKESTDFLEYGWNNIKNARYPYRHGWEYWRIPHMIGFNYAIEMKDIKKGIPFIEEVARIPEAPSFYRTWISTLYRRSGQTDKAANILERELIVENLRTALSQNIDDELKKQITRRLKKLYGEFYDKNYAKQKLQELIEQSVRLRQFYVENFPYLSREQFFVTGAYKALDNDEDNLVDLIFFDR